MKEIILTDMSVNRSLVHTTLLVTVPSKYKCTKERENKVRRSKQGPTLTQREKKERERREKEREREGEREQDREMEGDRDRPKQRHRERGREKEKQTDRW